MKLEHPKVPKWRQVGKGARDSLRHELFWEVPCISAEKPVRLRTLPSYEGESWCLNKGYTFWLKVIHGTLSFKQRVLISYSVLFSTSFPSYTKASLQPMHFLPLTPFAKPEETRNECWNLE